jgi:glucosyl-dolichyl phosphate glucuronosyltransferase
MKVSVIIPTYNRSEYLFDIIACLQKQTIGQGQIEIIVVDNSPDARFKQIKESIKDVNIRYVWEKRPGAHRARNTGALEAKGDICVFLDDDELFDQNLLHYLSEPFNNREIGCVGGKMLPKWEVTELPDFYSAFDKSDITHLDLGEEPRILRGWGGEDWEEIWGGNMAVRRDVYLEVGGMNPDLFPDKLIWFTGDGECGLQQKIREAGYKIFYEPRACVYNRICASRLTKEFLIKRRIYRSITMSFTNIRRLKDSRFFTLRLIKHAARCYVNAFVDYCFKSYPCYLARKVEAISWCARAEHHIRAVVNKNFRNYILLDSYL